METGRRRTLGLIGGAMALAAAYPHALGQPRPRRARIGILAGRSAIASVESDPIYAAFLQRMRELGYRDGSGVEYLWRFAGGSYERLPKLAAELVSAKVDVIVAATPPSVSAAMRATGSIPIVMVAVGDPVALGFVASLSRPGGNVTGVSNAIDDVSTKYLELLRVVMPKLSRVAVLANPDNPNYLKIFAPIEASARKMAIEVRMAEARTPAGIESGFEALRKFRPGALIVQGDGFLSAQRRQIADLAVRDRIATMAWTRELVEAGVLMSYGQNVPDDFINAANFVDRILRGALPRDLPVEQPTNPKLTINRKTAKALGLKLPPELLLRAAEVIE